MVIVIKGSNDMEIKMLQNNSLLVCDGYVK